MTSSIYDTGTSDFDFLRGDWLVRHRRLAARLVGSERWDTFDGTMTSQPILGGQGNIDDTFSTRRPGGCGPQPSELSIRQRGFG